MSKNLLILAFSLNTNILQTSLNGGRNDDAALAAAFDNSASRLAIIGVSASNFVPVNEIPNQSLDGVFEGSILIFQIAGDDFLPFTKTDNSILMNTRFGGTGYDALADVEFGSDGNVYFLGVTASPNIQTTGFFTSFNTNL